MDRPAACPWERYLELHLTDHRFCVFFRLPASDVLKLRTETCSALATPIGAQNLLFLI